MGSGRQAARKWELSRTCLDFARARLVTLSASASLIRADLLVTIAWNTDGTDVDLHVTEPGGEECFYEHTHYGLRRADQPRCNGGPGPGTVHPPHAPAGAYHIRAHYFAGDANRASARTKVYATIYELGNARRAAQPQGRESAAHPRRARPGHAHRRSGDGQFGFQVEARSRLRGGGRSVPGSPLSTSCQLLPTLPAGVPRYPVDSGETRIYTTRFSRITCWYQR
jgi:hypothetical protein